MLLIWLLGLSTFGSCLVVVSQLFVTWAPLLVWVPIWAFLLILPGRFVWLSSWSFPASSREPTQLRGLALL